jgi:hypothetical protein
MPDPNNSPNITVDQAILIASRIIAAYLILWAIDDLTLLPRVFISVAHYMHKTGSVLGTNTSLPETSYLLHYYIQELLGIVLRMTLWLMAAGWFYRCGPPIQNFFTAGDE